MLALIGPNGAGKTHAAALPDRHVLRPAGGGHPARRPAARRRSSATCWRECVAVVPGQTVVSFPMRVEELVALGPHPARASAASAPARPTARRVEHAIERVGIAHLRGRDVRELSLGERQLAVLAMAVAQDARLLLLDEPTVHLDLRHQVAIMELLRDLARRDGVTVLAVLHDIVLARHFFERLLLLDGGRLVADGRPAEVLSASRVRAVYGVDPWLVLERGEAELAGA